MGSVPIKLVLIETSNKIQEVNKDSFRQCVVLEGHVTEEWHDAGGQGRPF